MADWAEQARRDIHRRWFNQEALPWPRLVTIEVHRDHPGYYATSFTSDGVVTITLWAGDPHLESTVRHEVWHACVHLRYPGNLIPRWIDEGLAVCNESKVEQERMLAPLFRTNRRFPLRELLSLREYPREVYLFYAQSYSLADFLVRKHGEKQVIRFLETSFRVGQEKALQQVLGYGSIEELEREWLAWGSTRCSCGCWDCDCR